ncbi:MAG: hypothetical protein JWR51_3815 [Devosia sp.]|nr:hypothetical protein [Devosia sp.]
MRYATDDRRNGGVTHAHRLHGPIRHRPSHTGLRMAGDRSSQENREQHEGNPAGQADAPGRIFPRHDVTQADQQFQQSIYLLNGVTMRGVSKRPASWAHAGSWIATPSIASAQDANAGRSPCIQGMSTASQPRKSTSRTTEPIGWCHMSGDGNDFLSFPSRGRALLITRASARLTVMSADSGWATLG